MPYMMSDNGLCVHKQNANGTMGDVVKCHKTPDEAAAHMAALYANVEDASAKETGPASDYLITEDPERPSTHHLRVKVDGKPDHTLMGAAWAALMNPNGYRGNKYEGPGKQEAVAKLKRLYDAEGMPVPSEKETLFIADADAELSDAEIQAIEQLYQDIGAGRVTLESLTEPDAVTGKASVSYGNRSGGSSGPAGNPSGTPGWRGLRDKQEKCYLRIKKLGADETTARKVCRSLFGESNKEARQGASFTVYKQADGNYRWLAVTSSSFQDRDNEFVSQKALEADAERMNASGDFGALDWWHTPIVLGACDFSAMHGRLSVESGTFNDAWIATKLAEAKGGFEMSRAFMHPITEPDANGVYHNIKTFSRAIIPSGKGKASNLLTTFAVVEKEKQMLTDKINELKAMFGGNKDASDKVDALLAEAEKKEQAAVAAGLTAKEQKPEAAPEAKPEDKPEPKEEKGWFVADMTPEQFADMMAKGIAAAVEPVLKEMAAMKDAQAVAVKESSANVLAAVMQEVKKLQDAQAATAAQVKELNGLTPRGYRATQDPATATTKDTKPGADEKANYFAQFVNGFVLGQPQPPVK